ncbi:MAG: hypothetical protein P1U70_16395 [Saprospiraceae bacterium]|jgi:hypothetical protein|nr:hypothetical protein [Saprospiraceae bacterium]
MAEEVKKELAEKASTKADEVKGSFKKGLSSFYKKFKIVVFILLVIALGVGLFFVFGTYSNGYRAGNVMKVSKKGVVFKTWEGQLNVGGLQGGETASDVATTVWNFSVTNEAIVDDIEEAVDVGTRVKLHYREKYMQFDFRGDTKYIGNYSAIKIAD